MAPELKGLASAAEPEPEMGPAAGPAEDPAGGEGEGGPELGEADIAMMLRLRRAAARQQPQRARALAVGAVCGIPGI
jgi:hypothetical protein